ncbi:MAG: hypothetical protein MJ070_02935 [Lachnospiraceae bacterium]|nr:hypothetical protein [Lachnospiraceae bacterium]
MKKALVLLLTLTMVLSAMLISVSAEGKAPVTEVEVPYKEATIDGVVDPGEWDGATALVLNISDTKDWTTPGAGLVGNKDAALKLTDADFTNSIRLMYKDGYLYYLEERTDTTPFFRSANLTMPYCQDSTLVWFVDRWHTDVTPDSLAVFPRSLKDGQVNEEPFISRGIQNKQDDAEPLQDTVYGVTVTDNGFTLEAKIPLEQLGLTERYLALGLYGVTYCCVDITDPNFSGKNTDLWAENFQAQYTGVNTWQDAPVIKLTGDKTYDYEPETTPDPNKVKADEATEKINAIPEITADNYSKSGTKVKNARNAYDKLSDEAKALVNPDVLKKLTDAEAAIEKFKAEAEAAKETEAPATEAPATEAPGTEAPKAPEKSSNVGLIIGIVAAVVVVAAVVAILLAKKKKQ